MPWRDPLSEEWSTAVADALRVGNAAPLVTWLHQEGLHWPLPRGLRWWNAAWASRCPQTLDTLVGYLTMNREGQEVLETVYKQAYVDDHLIESEYAYARLSQWPAGERLATALDRDWMAAAAHLVNTMHPHSVATVARRLMRAHDWPSLDRLSGFMPASTQTTWLRRYPGCLPQTLARRRQQQLTAKPPVVMSSRPGRRRA